MKSRKRLIALVALIAAIALAVTFAAIRMRTAPVTPTQLVPPTWEQARTSPMHAAHVERGKIACNECHTTGFGGQQKPNEAACTKCHEAAAKKAHHGSDASPTKCVTCHAFGAGKQGATCVECHGAKGKDAGSAEGAGRAAHELARHVSKEAACLACHDVHGDAAKGARVVLADCTACHTSIAVTHGKESAGGHAGADPADAGESFDAAVARFAADSRAAAGLRDGGGAAHGGSAQVCTTCHAPHSPALAARETCATCHAGTNASNAPRIAPRGKHVAGHEACVTCHEPHRARKADVRGCEGCHADHASALATEGHTACTGCHAPHAPAEARASCASSTCHGAKVTLASARVSSHQKCESCHDPHRPTESPALACARCHADVKPKHPGFKSKMVVATACVGCHAPHPTAAAAAKATTSSPCSSCHTKAHGDGSLHAGGVTCTKCHAPHEFGSAMLASHGGGVKGKAKPETLALCAQCHAERTRSVAARPGHADCTGCHGATHTPTKKPACTQCHAQEAASAPRGHAACTQCHDAHSGDLGKHAVCTSCHAEKTKALHGALPGASCASCHAAHGPKGIVTPPPCATCHTPAKLEGLHGIGAHAANCASCHSSHTPPRSDRATCTTTCHTDRKTHQPAAQLCKGCHMFRK